MQRTILAMVLALAPACASMRAADEDELLAVCRSQEAAWNRGDLETFMAEGYWNSPELTFFSGGSDTRGYHAMLVRYRERYQQGGNEMGKLSFTDLRGEAFGPDAGLVRGRWKVAFTDGKSVGGLFTLVMRRREEGWRIVHDHTSAGE